ncbi:unnamed protein product [Adineta steineri]|uniref:Uncharacterized protein n=1 Tax=Adineta steineri TaxID=433720 RepID=A0A814TRA5_9BILA|nr:unnamed protein product [Adineta steineri]CAF3833079.1 unnamed protein product [Adineta steineri]
MEHHKAMNSNLTTIDSNNNNNNKSRCHQHHHHHHRWKKRISKQQQLGSLLNKPQVLSMSITDHNTNQENISLSEQQQQQQQHQQIPMKNSLSWKKKWSKWFSSCSSERTMHVKSNSIKIPIEKRPRTKSENDLSKRGSTDQDENKNLSPTYSTFAISPITNENLSKTSSHQHRHHHQSNDKVNNSNSVIYRDTSRRYSNTFFSSIRCGGATGEQHQSQTSISAIPSITKTSQPYQQKQQAQQLSRSADRLNSKSSRRELRYEEHNDYIPPPLPLNSIQCHPTIDHYARALNQSSYFYSTHRRSQIEVYQLSSPNNRLILPRPYSTNFSSSQNNPSSTTTIPITYSATVDNFRAMSQTSLDNNTYGRLSDCHSSLIPVGNSLIKAPRRIESTYSQFPTIQQEPVYANTQSLYDNILYPDSTSTNKISINRNEKKSCASQTQLTWTMATFSSFVDLENQSIIIQQPDPTTLYSVVRHQHATEPPPSASPATIEHMKRMSPNLQYIDDTTSPSHNQRPHTPNSSKMLMIEKRDGSFQTLLTIAPMDDIDSTKPIIYHDSTPSPLSTGSSSTTDHHHHNHNHRHRRHKSRSNTSRNNISTRDVGLQVSIQTVKKITFSTQQSDDSSLTTTATTSSSSPPTIKTSRELKNVQTNTEPFINKQDRSTSYEKTLHMITSSSQTLDSPMHTNRQTKSAQTPTKSLRDQSTETNNQGLFLCDLSSFLKNGTENTSSNLTVTTKRKI